VGTATIQSADLPASARAALLGRLVVAPPVLGKPPREQRVRSDPVTLVTLRDGEPGQSLCAGEVFHPCRQHQASLGRSLREDGIVRRSEALQQLGAASGILLGIPQVGGHGSGRTPVTVVLRVRFEGPGKQGLHFLPPGTLDRGKDLRVP
jgi:hypothetical protein